SPDPFLRQNYQLVAVPDLAKEREGYSMKWVMIPNTGPDFPEYAAWKNGSRRNTAEYPRDSPEEMPAPEFPWFFLFFDSSHKVPIMFQAPLDPAKVGLEAAEMKS